jgi:hypothetical protein
VRPTVLFASLLLIPSIQARADIANDAEEHSDVEVSVALDPAAQSGRASASVKIHARREVIWPLLTSCKDALEMVPGLVTCEVLATAPDKSWQLIRQVMNYSWYVPRLTYVMRAEYEYPARVSIERVTGDLRVMKGSWYLESDGEFTVAHYALDLAPGFWVPRWLVRAALRHDLPKLLRALRERAESTHTG